MRLTKMMLRAAGGLYLAFIFVFSGAATAALGDYDLGYMVISDTATTADCGGGQCFTLGPNADIVNDGTTGMSFAGGVMSLGPNYTFYRDNNDAFWRNGDDGNKTVLSKTFGEQVGVPAGTGVVSVDGFMDEFTFPAGYTVQAFIAVLDPAAGFTDILGARQTISGSGRFELTADLTIYEPSTTLIVQTGFEIVGLNANPANAADFAGSARIGARTAQGAGNSSGFVDPTGIPVMPLWGLLGLAGLIGFMGYRRKRA